MSDRQLRNLTPDAPRRWKVIGLELAHKCTFCGRPSSATVGCPDDGAPILWQAGVCDDCLTDCVMARFAEVKAARVAQLAMDMTAASEAIGNERRKFHAERSRRRAVAHYRLPTNAPRRQEDAAERVLEEQRRFGETIEQTKARLQADLEAWEKSPLRNSPRLS